MVAYCKTLKAIVIALIVVSLLHLWAYHHRPLCVRYARLCGGSVAVTTREEPMTASGDAVSAAQFWVPT